MSKKRSRQIFSANLRAGEWVEVRSQDEILSTLDDHGCLDNLPFMPEMLQYCGERFPVYKRADKACDTISEGRKGSRRMRNAVHLANLRCDGDCHGGCDNTCLIYWKEAWLRRIGEGRQVSVATTDDRISEIDDGIGLSKCTIDDLFKSVRSSQGDVVYVCQATELVKATSAMSWWDIRQYWRELASRNVGIIDFICVMFVGMLNYCHNRLFGGGSYRPLWPHMDTRLMLNSNTPHEILNLQPGEIVEVKNLQEILRTLDKKWKNRGLYYDETGEMLKYCDKKFMVLKRVKKVMNERTGQLIELKNESVILDGVICCGHYSPGRLLCPRSIHPFWREIWLKRIEEEDKR